MTSLSTAKKMLGGRAPFAAMALLWLASHAALAFWKPDFSFPDERWYLEIARNLRAHGEYRMDVEGDPVFAVRQSPGLPFVLAAAGQVVPLTPRNAKLVNVAMAWLGVLGLGGAAVLLSRRWPIGTAVLAATGAHAPFAYLSATNYPNSGQSMALAALVLLWAWLQARRPAWLTRPAAGLAEGFVLATGAWFAPMHILLLPAYALARLRTALAHRLAFLVCLGLGATLALAPWTLRNLVAEQRLIPFSTSGGEQMYLGNNPEAGMNSGVLVERPASLERELAAARSGSARDALYARYAREWMQDNPGRALRLWSLKLLNYFRWDTGTLYVSTEQGGALRTWLTRLTSLGVFAVALAGAWRFRASPSGRAWTTFAAVGMLLLAAGHAFFISRYRYRLPYEPFLLWFGIVGLAAGDRTEGRRSLPGT